MRPEKASGQSFTKTPMSPEATSGRWLGSGHSSMLNEIGKSRSAGSKSTTSFMRDFGMKRKAALMRSPWGSTTPTPLPAMMSLKIMFSSTVDFPIPVLPMM